MQRIERLAYLVLRKSEAAGNDGANIFETMLNSGNEIDDLGAREIGRFVKDNGYGMATELTRGDMWITCYEKGKEFVRKNEVLTFDEEIKVIFMELEHTSGRKAKLADLLRRTGIEWTSADEKLFLAQIEETGYAQALDPNKDFINIQLTKLGSQYLHGKLEPKQPSAHMQFTQYIANGPVGALGNNASTTNSTIIQNNHTMPNNADLEALAKELQFLIDAIKADANKPDHYEEMSVVAHIKEAAEKKDSSKFFEQAKRLGPWALDKISALGLQKLILYLADKVDWPKLIPHS